ncbi:MAG: ABC transporter permease [Bacteroidota bacterium]
MLRIILKSAWRQLWNNKGYSSINILGMAVGLAVAMLSALWVQYHSNFDEFHANAGDIYQAYHDFTPTGEDMQSVPALPYPMAAVLRDETPGVKHVAIVDWGNMGTALVRGETQLLKSGYHVQPDFLKIFSFPLLQGDVETALSAPHQIILTEATAKEIFGEDDPMGETITIGDNVSLQITGVITNPPVQSSWQFDFLLPHSLKEQQEPWIAQAIDSWSNQSFQIFFQMEEGADAQAVKALHRDIFLEKEGERSVSKFSVYPMTKWHLYGEFEQGEAVNGLIRYVRLFGIIGVLVLLIACVNFINITTARAEKRSKEVGVRKAVGAGQRTLITQFLGEAGVTMLFSFGLAVILLVLLLPHFNTLVESEIKLPFASPTFWLASAGIILITTLMAGSYPAFFLTRFEAKSVLHKSFQIGRGGNMWSRRLLVSSQFTISIALIAGSLIIHKQVRYAQERDMGYNQERLLAIPNNASLDPRFDAIKAELLAANVVDEVTASGSPITSVWSNMGNINWPGKAEDEHLGFAFIATSDNYFDVLEIDFAEGRPFRASGADTLAMIVNQAAVKRMGLEDPLGTQLTWNDVAYPIIGVVEDVIMETPFEPVRPTVFIYNPVWRSFFMMRINEHLATEQALATIQPIFEKHDPTTPFNYEFVEETYSQKFTGTNFVGTVALLFAGLAIFLSALGLLGLALYLAERRAKEISIRKILGASIGQLWLLLSREFMLLIVIGGVLAIPLGAYFTEGWLTNFTYRIDLPWVVFGIAIAIALFIALATISAQSIKAALVNPADRLRDD